ncbi:M20 family metallo-hydrolase [Marinoscillum sp. MHG1-6]|uniref:M20 family metallo-hydrolase n=1 Tax=Marinoscillum sp. MHG1-6 TaxID=2959627 RepID=UPI002157C374|nr:M20 family metallo-hydrolase [Marinoscillum sp. MHG1-6]
MALSFRRNIENIHAEAIKVLSSLIETPSLSKEEDETAALIESYLESNGVETFRSNNNVWARNLHFDPEKPTILLNSHHDTVKPNQGYIKDPYKAIILGDKLYGLGSNDAGGALVSLMFAFLYLYDQENLHYNLVFAATAEEEISGRLGVASILSEIGEIAFGIVGEPTEMNMAIAEKGLMVLDCYAPGKSGHAAREEGENAIYNAIKDIEWFRNFNFPKESEYLGPVKMSVTMIEAGYQHNVVPDECHFVVDIRGTDAYSNDEMLEIIRANVLSEVKERSTRLQPSFITKDHPLIKAAEALDIEFFGSPTLSDQALMPFPTVKIGPGLSQRSHTADEYIFVDEIREGVTGYLALLNKIIKS